MVRPIVVDSYAWIEYAEGTEEGKTARRYIEGDHPLFTPAIVVGELTDKAVRTGTETPWEERLLPYIRRHTSVVPIDGELAGEAGRAKWGMREASPEAGLADAIVLAVAREHDAVVLTGDPDFLVDALAEEVIDVTESDRAG